MAKLVRNETDNLWIEAVANALRDSFTVDKAHDLFDVIMKRRLKVRGKIDKGLEAWLGPWEGGE